MPNLQAQRQNQQQTREKMKLSKKLKSFPLYLYLNDNPLQRSLPGTTLIVLKVLSSDPLAPTTLLPAFYFS